MKSIYHTKTPEETMALGQKLAQRLSGGSVVLLHGDLGAGKTHFTKGIARGLGVEGIIKSPTFAYINSYPLLKGKEKGRGKGVKQNMPLPSPLPEATALYHYDLYRLSPGDDLSSIGLDDTLNDPEAVNVIEWADRLEEAPKDHIQVHLKAGRGVVESEEGSVHQITIEFHDSTIAPPTKVQTFWEEWKTPEHVQKHCKQVASVALQLGQAMVDTGHILDLNSLNTAALLHDMARVCDFKTLDRSHFSEPITDERWEAWLELRKQFKGQRHGDIAATFLREKGYSRTAHLIAHHHFIDLLHFPELFEEDVELAIVYYADKRVKHDQIVSVADRLADGRVRYLQNATPEQIEESKAIENQILALESRFFEGLGVGPGEIE